MKICGIPYENMEMPAIWECTSSELFLQPTRDRSQTIVGGPDAKRGSLKVRTIVSGALKKYHKFSTEN